MSLALKCIYACDRYKNVMLLCGLIYDHVLILAWYRHSLVLVQKNNCQLTMVSVVNLYVFSNLSNHFAMIHFVLMITGLISWRWQTALWSVFHSILQCKRLDHGCSYVCFSTALFDSFMTQVLQEVCRVAQASGQSRGLSQVHIDNSRRQYAHSIQAGDDHCMHEQSMNHISLKK